MIVGLAQISPVWLNRSATIAKATEWIEKAAAEGCQLVAFGEALVPGYPFWPELTNGAVFNSTVQKEFYATYVKQAVTITSGDLKPVCQAARQHAIAVYIGIIELPEDRGSHSLYASLVYINSLGEIESVHRKLQPTYEDRLNWSQGDGHGLVTHRLHGFTVGGLNCWENWMPLPRAALYAQGENLHVAAWPGSGRNTKDITRFIALESRSYVLSVSGLMRKTDFPPDTLHLDKLLAKAPDILCDGGSCLAAPDGSWLVSPQVGSEQLITAEITLEAVLQERQNFDPAGHYSRPDVISIDLDNTRQSTLRIKK